MWCHIFMVNYTTHTIKGATRVNRFWKHLFYAVLILSTSIFKTEFKHFQASVHFVIFVRFFFFFFFFFLFLPSQSYANLPNQTVKINKDVSFSFCYPFPEEWGPYYAKSVVMVKFLVYYLIPLLIIGLVYVMMALHLSYSANVPGEIQGAVRQVSRLSFSHPLSLMLFVYYYYSLIVFCCVLCKTTCLP